MFKEEPNVQVKRQPEPKVEGTNVDHRNAEGIARVRVDPPVRLWSAVEAGGSTEPLRRHTNIENVTFVLAATRCKQEFEGHKLTRAPHVLARFEIQEYSRGARPALRHAG